MHSTCEVLTTANGSSMQLFLEFVSLKDSLCAQEYSTYVADKFCSQLLSYLEKVCKIAKTYPVPIRMSNYDNLCSMGKV